MRGTHYDFPAGLAHARIIPADAGNTRCSWTPSCRARDQPRGCGEHEPLDDREDGSGGSSPRMRGTRLQTGRLHRRFGIIPADAGNTWGIGLTGFPAWDHPRGCGEHPVWSSLGSCSRGSSPRMRGTRRVQITPAHDLGIIPADAGNTVTRT